MTSRATLLRANGWLGAASLLLVLAGCSGESSTPPGIKKKEPFAITASLNLPHLLTSVPLDKKIPISVGWTGGYGKEPKDVATKSLASELLSGFELTEKASGTAVSGKVVWNLAVSPFGDNITYTGAEFVPQKPLVSGTDYVATLAKGPSYTVYAGSERPHGDRVEFRAGSGPPRVLRVSFNGAKEGQFSKIFVRFSERMKTISKSAVSLTSGGKPSSIISFAQPRPGSSLALEVPAVTFGNQIVLTVAGSVESAKGEKLDGSNQRKAGTKFELRRTLSKESDRTWRPS